MLRGRIPAEDHGCHKLLLVHSEPLRCTTFALIGVLYYVYNDWFGFLLYVSLIPMALTTLLSMFLIV